MDAHAPESLPEPPTPATVPSTTDGTVVWHRRALRTADHPALASAAEQSETVLPLFIFDPAFYGDDGLACDARIGFLHECLVDLERQYEQHGHTLSYAHGDPRDILHRFSANGWDVVATADATSRYGRERDTAAATQCDVTFVAGDGLTRGQHDSREGWSDRVEQWFTDDPYTWSPDIISVSTLSTSITPARIAAHYGIHPTKTSVLTGGREAALDRLDEFCANLASYPASISSPSKAKTGTSRLSPYLRFGCLSVREAYQAVTNAPADEYAAQMFVSRLYWNRHYTQKLVDWPGWTTRAVNPALVGFHADSHDPSLVDAWKAGQTGFPMVDASMRCLAQTGWLNFRMRAMCASFLCDLLQQPWRVGADWFYYHLIDADPAINYTQFQSQAGVVGVNMERVYNPRKQVRDNDPEGTFIANWVPELEALPTAFLDQPEKTPLAVQSECGVRIGEDYPYPIIDYAAARERIYTKIEQVREQAKAVLQQPEVARRCSFSRRAQTESTDSSSSGEQSSSARQSSLDQFS